MSDEHEQGHEPKPGWFERVSCHADKQCNMQMNKPVWVVEDAELIKSPEGRQKLQDTVTDNTRLNIFHGADFGKVSPRQPCPSGMTESVQHAVYSLSMPAEHVTPGQPND